MFGKSPWFQVGITKSILMVGWWLKEIIPWRQNLKDKCCILGKEEQMQASKFVIFIGSVYRLLLWHLLPNKSFLPWSKAWVVKKQKSLTKKRAKNLQYIFISMSLRHKCRTDLQFLSVLWIRLFTFIKFCMCILFRL